MQGSGRLEEFAAGKPLTGWTVYNVPLNPADLGKLHFKGRPSGIQAPVRKSKAAIWSSDLQTFYGENLPDAVIEARPDEADLAALRQQEEAGALAARLTLTAERMALLSLRDIVHVHTSIRILAAVYFCMSQNGRCGF